MTTNMAANVVLLVICATAVSARHLFDVNLVQYSDTYVDGYTKSALERRNIAYGSEANLNQYGPSVESLRETYLSYPTNGDFNENVDSYNNIGYPNEDSKLRTNAYPTDFTFTTEYSDDTFLFTNVKHGVYTRRESGDLKPERLPAETTREPDQQFNRHGEVQTTKIPLTAPKTNIDKDLKRNSSVKTNLDSNKHYIQSATNQNNITQKGTVANKSNNKRINETAIPKAKVNLPQIPVAKNPKTNVTRTVISERGKAMSNGTLPQEKTDLEEEIAWVWGTEASNTEATTSKDDLDNRAAFSGDKCPTGKAKVFGKCADKQ